MQSKTQHPVPVDYHALRGIMHLWRKEISDLAKNLRPYRCEFPAVRRVLNKIGARYAFFIALERRYWQANKWVTKPEPTAFDRAVYDLFYPSAEPQWRLSPGAVNNMILVVDVGDSEHPPVHYAAAAGYDADVDTDTDAAVDTDPDAAADTDTNTDTDEATPQPAATSTPATSTTPIPRMASCDAHLVRPDPRRQWEMLRICNNHLRNYLAEFRYYCNPSAYALTLDVVTRDLTNTLRSFQR